MIVKIVVWLLVLWWGLKARWSRILVVGLVWDLVDGGSLGVTSLIFLGVTGVVYMIYQYWPIRKQEQLRLKI